MLQAQETVTGKVIDSENGQELIGVSILIQGTSSGTVTDIDGNYTIDVMPENTLMFSYTGYKAQQIAVGNKTTIDISLLVDSETLQEVVVVGYGTQVKKDLTGSVSTLQGDDVLAAPTPNLKSNLAGKMTGVITRQTTGKPGSDAGTFLIRGKSTFGDNNALILVDGIERSIDRIDPNDIASISILKDAASAAIYGARAANGVVLITTKRGKSGKPQFNYNGSYGFQSPVNIPDVLNAGEFAQYFNEARLNTGDDPLFTDQQVSQYQNGTLPSTDWWGATFEKNAPVHQHGLTVSGGTDVANYFISFGYLDQSGMHALSSFKRYNARSNLDINLSPRLKLGLDLSGRTEDISDSSQGNDAFNNVLTAQPTSPAFVPDAIEPGGLNYNGVNISPIGQAIHSGADETNWNVFQSMLTLDYDLPVDGLSAKYRYSFDRSVRKDKFFERPYTFYVYDPNNDIYNPFPSITNIRLEQGYTELTQETIQASLNYRKTFGKHTLSALTLFEQVDFRREGIEASRQGFISSAIDQLFAGSAIGQQSDGRASESARQGYVGRVSYNFSDKYLVQVNARYDGSFNFPKDSRWGFFPAISLGWRITEENFFNIPGLDMLKVRASWGQFGNDRVSPFQYLAGYGFDLGSVIGSSGSYFTGLSSGVLPNPNITWETATSRNIGIDYSIWGGKISGELDFFSKRTEDILIARNASVPATFGAELPRENLGIVDSKGFEASLTYRDKFGDFNIEFSPNITRARSNVVFIDEPNEVDDRIRRTGRPFDQLYGLIDAGIFQTQAEIDAWPDQDGQQNASMRPGDIKYEDINGDGVVDGFDITAIGKSTLPEIIYGLNLYVDYKGIGLSLNLQGATDFDSYAFLGTFQLGANSLRERIVDSWRPNNTGATFPIIDSGSTVNNIKESTFWMIPGNYLKLRNIELSYSIPSSVVSNWNISNLRFYVSGNNLLTFSRYKHFDPERPVSTAGNPLYYPQLKRVNFGINLGF